MGGEIFLGYRLGWFNPGWVPRLHLSSRPSWGLERQPGIGNYSHKKFWRLLYPIWHILPQIENIHADFSIVSEKLSVSDVDNAGWALSCGAVLTRGITQFSSPLGPRLPPPPSSCRAKIQIDRDICNLRWELISAPCSVQRPVNITQFVISKLATG